MYTEPCENTQTGVEPSWKTHLRGLARYFLCRAGYEPCIAEAREQFKKWMTDKEPDNGNPCVYIFIDYAFGLVILFSQVLALFWKQLGRIFDILFCTAGMRNICLFICNGESFIKLFFFSSCRYTHMIRIFFPCSNFFRYLIEFLCQTKC